MPRPSLSPLRRPSLRHTLPFVLALVLLPATVSAWGPLGHRLVADLAWEDLTPKTRSAIQELLRGEPDRTLPGIANWADTLRETDPDLGKRSAKWHYVNIGEEDCNYDAGRDCPNGNCVVEAIREQTAILADRTRPQAERVQALKFVVHFVGDVHQPLHAGYARDKGGNDLQVNLNGRGTNLHSLWDSGLLNTARLDEAAYLKRLQALPLAVPSKRPALPPDAARWAEASCQVVKEDGFYPERAKLDASYAERWRPVAEERLRAGGSQLAAVLNGALGR